MSAPLFSLLHSSSSACSVGMVCSVGVPVSAPLVSFAPKQFQFAHLVWFVPFSTPLVWFAPLEFQCLRRWYGFLR